jgi:hypothetical protein
VPATSDRARRGEGAVRLVDLLHARAHEAGELWVLLSTTTLPSRHRPGRRSPASRPENGASGLELPPIPRPLAPYIGRVRQTRLLADFVPSARPQFGAATARCPVTSGRDSHSGQYPATSPRSANRSDPTLAQNRVRSLKLGEDHERHEDPGCDDHEPGCADHEPFGPTRRALNSLSHRSPHRPHRAGN